MQQNRQKMHNQWTNKKNQKNKTKHNHTLETLEL